MSQARSAEWYRATYRDASVSGIVAAATAGVADVIAALDADHTIFIQRITVNVNTLGAQTVKFQDDATTPVVALFLEASVAAGAIREIDFGARGFALTEAKNLDIVGTAAPAYSYSIEAYQRLTGPGQATTTDRLNP